MKYYNAVKVNDLIFSVDMIRFKFELSEYLQKQLYIIIKQIQTYDYFNSYNNFHYRELFKIKTSDLKQSFSLGLGFNGLKNSEKNLCFLEFNPNKLYDSLELNKILCFLNNYGIDLELVLYDLAVDIPYNKKFVSILKDKRVYKKFCYDQQGVNCTEYLGQAADSGRVKLYNKTIESNLDYELTRLELTTKCTDFDIVHKQLPALLVLQNFDLMSSIKLSKSDYVLLQLLWQSDDPNYYYKMLGRDKQQKLKPFVNSNFSLSFSQAIFDKLFDGIKFFKGVKYEIQKKDIQDSIFC